MNFKNEACYKIITIGSEAVGKTSLAAKYIDGTFDAYEPGTIGANYLHFLREIGDSAIEYQIWDTAGQEKFKSLGPIYYRQAHAAIVVFALDNKQSFLDLDEWVQSFTEVAGSESLVYIVANKCDLVTSFQVDLSEAETYARQRNYPFYVTSAKDGTGVHEVFDAVTDALAKVVHVDELNRVVVGRDTCC